MKRQTEELNWEGIVAKRKDSRYVTGIRSTDWLKIKNWKEIDVVILGYRLQPRFGLTVGLHFPSMDNKLVATVEFGFSTDEKAAFLAVVRQIHTVKDKHASGSSRCCVPEFNTLNGPNTITYGSCPSKVFYLARNRKNVGGQTNDP